MFTRTYPNVNIFIFFVCHNVKKIEKHSLIKAISSRLGFFHPDNNDIYLKELV